MLNGSVSSDCCSEGYVGALLTVKRLDNLVYNVVLCFFPV